MPKQKEPLSVLLKRYVTEFKGETILLVAQALITTLGEFTQDGKVLFAKSVKKQSMQGNAFT